MSLNIINNVGFICTNNFLFNSNVQNIIMLLKINSSHEKSTHHVKVLRNKPLYPCVHKYAFILPM